MEGICEGEDGVTGVPLEADCHASCGFTPPLPHALFFMASPSCPHPVQFSCPGIGFLWAVSQCCWQEGRWFGGKFCSLEALKPPQRPVRVRRWVERHRKNNSLSPLGDISEIKGLTVGTLYQGRFPLPYPHPKEACLRIPRSLSTIPQEGASLCWETILWFECGRLQCAGFRAILI